MIASTVWNNLINTLEGNETLKRYVKYVHKGFRFDIEPEGFPCIMLEPVRDGEIVKDYNQTKDVQLTIDVYAFTTPSYNDFTKSIVGDTSYKGIFDINNDIRACLQSSYDLGGSVIDVRVDETNYDSLEVKQYPIRGLIMPIRILYRQTNGV